MKRRSTTTPRRARRRVKSEFEGIPASVLHYDIDTIKRIAGVVAEPPTKRLENMQATLDQVELQLLARVVKRALDGDVEAAKFLLITKFGYRATGPTQPIKVDAKVVITTDKAPP